MKKVLLVSSCSDRPGAAQWLPWLPIQSSRLGQFIVLEVSTISILKKVLLISESMKNSPCHVLGGLDEDSVHSKSKRPCVPRRWCYLLLRILTVPSMVSFPPCPMIPLGAEVLMWTTLCPEECFTWYLAYLFVHVSSCKTSWFAWNTIEWF